ncbi:MAG: LOG family protein [Candidatus Magasanikiibacteriota bacterium]
MIKSKKTTKKTLFGNINKTIKLKNYKAVLFIKKNPNNKIEFVTNGLVVAFNGGGKIKENSKKFLAAKNISEIITKAGGIVMSGGRNTGIMEAVSLGGKKNALGVVFKEQIKKQVVSKHCQHIIVDGPTTRLSLLTEFPNFVIVYEGGIGTLHEIMNILVACKNTIKYNMPAPKIIMDQYWKKFIDNFIKNKILDKNYLFSLSYFKNISDIKKQLGI